jgi:Uma2 family endonuclease
MVRHIEDEIEYYYDSHSTEEDLMGETAFHFALVQYLFAVLTWLFEGQPCALHGNLNIYQTTNAMEYPLAPDIAVFKGATYQYIRSWKVGKMGPAPQVVFEIASKETWAKDLGEKPTKYARMGTQEYYAYDPNEPLLPQSKSRRLFGWQLDPHGIMRPMTPVNNGALWSKNLESWLVPDGVYLRLYDREGQMRLPRDEAEARQVEIEKRRAEVATWRAEIEAMRADDEAKRAKEAIRQAKVLREKLRSLGIDPDKVL